MLKINLLKRNGQTHKCSECGNRYWSQPQLASHIGASHRERESPPIPRSAFKDLSPSGKRHRIAWDRARGIDVQTVYAEHFENKKFITVVDKNRIYTRSLSKRHMNYIHKPFEELKRDSDRRKYLLRTCEHKCEICDRTEWRGKPIPVEMDHIDGNSANNTRENLRLVCPTCHSYTPNYRGRNIGKGSEERRAKAKKYGNYRTAKGTYKKDEIK